MAHITVADEKYIFRPEMKRKLYILLGVGIVLFLLGIPLANVGSGGHQEEASLTTSTHLLASADQHTDEGHQAAEAKHEGEHHAEVPGILKRIKTTLWMNNMYFVGLGIIGLFFVAIQYAAQAGWSAGLLRIPLAMANWIPIAGLITLGLWFFVSHDIFHWTHENLYSGEHADKLISKKAPYFFWPLGAGSFPLFYIARMVLFFGMWYWFFTKLKANMLAEDLDPSPKYWYKNRVTSAWFLIFFAISSSVAAWDWIMSIDTHWFSTMFGWYVFASWWVTALAVITLIVAHLKSAGYLKIVNANHLHDLGKFIFAFSIFWTYIWFSQFLLIYYANIPEETVYFIERMTTSPYSWIFYANLFLNFVFPFLLFMTRDSKRQLSTLKVICPIVVVGHWFDFYNMITPGVMNEYGGVGFIEIGTALIFAAVFLFVVLSSLAKVPLVGRNHPMLQESLHHHI